MKQKHIQKENVRSVNDNFVKELLLQDIRISLLTIYPIDYWSFIQRDPNRISSYIPDADFALEFYTEIPGKKNPKKKMVCNYNVKTKEFYK